MGKLDFQIHEVSPVKHSLFGSWTGSDHKPLQHRAEASDNGLVGITDTTNTFQLVAMANGNLHMDNITQLTGTSQWATASNAVYGDSSDRFLIYFPATMKASGVSRLRLASWGSIPQDANLAMLVQVGDHDGTSLMLAIDTESNYFYPIVCLLNGQDNKVFLVKDPSNIDFVADQSLRYTVTGGVVSEFGYIPFYTSDDNIAALGRIYTTVMIYLVCYRMSEDCS
ncbi:hypothetical protein ANO11243_091950 [Dothideomycetidae sp. 11243]|nr:hypothetical protein ANO11243_091950 [fungal sp. No.11243]